MDSFTFFFKKTCHAWIPGFLASLIFFTFCLLENNPFSSTALANQEMINPKFFESLLPDYRWVIVVFYLKILVLYLIMGISLNLFFYASLFTLQKLTQHFFSKIKFFFLLFFLVFLFFLLQLAKKIAHYPQLFDEHFYLKGSAYFDIARFFTTYFTPSLLSGIQILFILSGFVLIVYAIAEWGWKKRFFLGRIFKQIIFFCLKQKKSFFSLLGLIVILAAAFIVFYFQSKPRETYFTNVIVFSSKGLNENGLIRNPSTKEIAPSISNLASKGTVFSNIYSPSMEEYPSWASIMTSRYPFSHGINHNLPSYKNKKKNFKTLASYLNKKGYYSSFVGDRTGNLFKEADFGFNEVQIPSRNIPQVIKQLVLKSQPFLLSFFLNSFGEKIFPCIAGMVQYSEPEILSSSILKKIDRSQKLQAPFFIVAGVSYTHTPYALPYPFYRKYGDPKYHGKYLYQYSRFNPPAQPLDPDDEKQARALYDGSLQAFDFLIEKTLNSLKERNLLENTLIVILSTHGENINVKMANRLELSENQEGYRIPLIFSGPGVEQGKIEAKIASSIDIVPTILDYLGFKEKPVYFNGQSLLKPIERELEAYLETGVWYSKSHWPERILYPDINEISKRDSFLPNKIMIQPDYENLIQTAKQRMIISRGFKLIYLPLKGQTVFQLFDLKNDPGQKDDLSKKNPLKLAEMKKIFFCELLKDSGLMIKDEYIVPVFNEPLF